MAECGAHQMTEVVLLRGRRGERGRKLGGVSRGVGLVVGGEVWGGIGGELPSGDGEGGVGAVLGSRGRWAWDGGCGTGGQEVGS